MNARSEVSTATTFVVDALPRMYHETALEAVFFVKPQFIIPSDDALLQFCYLVDVGVKYTLSKKVN